MKRIGTFLAILWISTMECGYLQAATFVLSDASGKALQDTIDSATSGDVIRFHPDIIPDITVTTEITIQIPLTIIGRPDGKTIIHGNNCPIFNIQTNGVVELVDMTLRDGLARGENGETGGSGGGGGCGMGGAIYGSGTIICDRVHFINNRAIGGNGSDARYSTAGGGRGGNGSHGFNQGGSGGQNSAGIDGGVFSGGGGGSGEWTGNWPSPQPGGKGGFGSGGGGGGGGSNIFITTGGGNKGEFGGNGGNGGGDWTQGGGGGGAGLGGAIFMNSGIVILENCEFKNNEAKAGIGGIKSYYAINWYGSNGENGEAKGGAVFARNGAKIRLFNTTFSGNAALTGSGNGFTSGSQNDTNDVYGSATTYTGIPASSKNLIVTSAKDERYGSGLGLGVTLREALQWISDGGEIQISASVSPSVLTMNSRKGTMPIEKNVTIKSLKNDFTIDGNGGQVFFVKSGHLQLENLSLRNAKAKGGNGGSGLNGVVGGGGAAGMGGAVFVNSNAALTCEDVSFTNCTAQGGNGGGGQTLYTGYEPAHCGGAGGGGIGGDGENRDGMYDNYKYGLGGIGWPLSSTRSSSNGGEGGGAGGGSYTGGFGGGGGGVGFNGGQTIFSNGGFGGGGGGSFYPSGYQLTVPINGGLFGGVAPYFAGGGGAGLGGAIFVRETGNLSLNRCQFISNQANGGIGGDPRIEWFYYYPFTLIYPKSSGQGKGGAIFAMTGSNVALSDCTFMGNWASQSKSSISINNTCLDNYDIYGVVTGLNSSPQFVQVTTSLDENDGPFQGKGMSLREALDYVIDGMEIRIPAEIGSATLAIEPSNGTFVIEKNVKIIALGQDPLVLDGNNVRAFFVKSGHLWLENLKIVNGQTRGGDGGGNDQTQMGGGGAAGMGGAIFVNTAAALTAVNVQFENCRVQGGTGGGGGSNPRLPGNGGGGGGIGGRGTPGVVAWIENPDREPTRYSNYYGGNGGNGSPLSDNVIKEGVNGSDGAGGGGKGMNPYGGNGGFGGGGGGGNGRGGYGGGSGGLYCKSITYDKVPGGMFGGCGVCNGGGGGAGLGGALFVREGGTLLLDACVFKNNTSIGGNGGNNPYGLPGDPGKGKGGAIFAMENAIAKVRNCSFIANAATDATEGVGFMYSMLSDTPDVYGVLNDLTDNDVSAFPSIEATPTPTSTVTPTPYMTPTPEIQPTPTLQPESTRNEFSGQTADENEVILLGAGFGAYPQAAVSFGAIPTDNAFDGATDGQGVIVTAQPGEGVIIFSERVDTTNAAMIRCSVRVEGASAAIVIASIGDEPNQFVSYNTPNNVQYFAGAYKRLTTFCTPPSTGFTPVVQILNTSQTEALTAYIDNLEIFFIDTNHMYHGDYLNGDETDPTTVKVEIKG